MKKPLPPSSTSKKRFFDLEELYKKNEYTIFDAIRDNKGKGIKAKDLIKVLRNKTTYKNLLP